MISASFLLFLSFRLYLLGFLLIHLPLDLLMLWRRRLPFDAFPDISLSKHDMILLIILTSTFWILVLAWCASFSFLSSCFFVVPRLPFSFSAILFWIGLLLFWIAALLEWIARIARGPYLSRSSPRLATSWSYALVRHPQYLSYALFFLSLPLLFLQPFFLVFLPGILAYYRLAKKEDLALQLRFQDEYAEYYTRVPLFFPFWK